MHLEICDVFCVLVKTQKQIKYKKKNLCYPTRSSTYAMALNTGISKAVVSLYRIDLETAFDRHRSGIPINDVSTVLALKKHLVSFLGQRRFCLVNMTWEIFM